MDYPCDKFGDFSFSRFGFIVRTKRSDCGDGRQVSTSTCRQSPQSSDKKKQTRMNALLPSIYKYSLLSSINSLPLRCIINNL